MSELKTLQAKEIANGLNEYYNSFSFDHKEYLAMEGISKYNGLKVLILISLGYTEHWVNYSHDAYHYNITTQELVPLIDPLFYHIYRWFMINTYSKIQT